MEQSVNLEMRKKQWTAQTNITDNLLKSREKRKWQIALRRYVLESNKCSYYAPYFGIGNDKFRQWIELQFDADTNWDNFGKRWQLEHVVPSSYFDFDREEEMKICWNFINIQVERGLTNGAIKEKIDLIAAKTYFERIYIKTGMLQCKRMVDWLEGIESAQIQNIQRFDAFFEENGKYLNKASSLSSYEFDQLNEGIEMEDILKEREILRKYGGAE